MNSQQTEAEVLHRQLAEAGSALAKADAESSVKLSMVLSEEKQCCEEEQASLISQITTMIQSQSQARDNRLEARIALLQTENTASQAAYRQQQVVYDTSMSNWSSEQGLLVDGLLKSRENVKAKIKKDWTVSDPLDLSRPCTNLYRPQMSTILRSNQPPVLSTRRPLA